jgi:ABC-type phosphate/phosphonate transport system permease subunit
LASHKLFGKWAWISDIFLILIRTFPEFLLGMMIVASAGSNAMAGVLALSLHGIGMIGKLYAEQFDDLNPETLEGSKRRWRQPPGKKSIFGVMPQAPVRSLFRGFVSFRYQHPHRDDPRLWNLL